jgi:hypothetical protein
VESKSLSKAILKTLSYADIFDYPLTEKEIWQYLVEEKTTQSQVSKSLKSLLNKGKVFKFFFFFLPGREKIAKKREKRAKLAFKKLKRAKLAARVLAIIPSVRLVGLTGALAMSNSKKEDDIDFLVVTSRDFLWTTRFLATTLLTILGLKRGRTAKKVAGKICLNMFIDETNLAFEDRNLFIAHEISQLKPLFERRETYREFLSYNKWVQEFLPNYPLLKTTIKPKLPPKPIFLAVVLEKLLKKAQLAYMYSHITTEKISDKILKFHPQDISFEVLSKYEKKVKSLKTS